MMQESRTEGGWEAAVRQTDPSYPALSGSARYRLLVAITAVGTSLGALPALVILDVLWLGTVFVAIGVVAPALHLQRFHTTKTVPPSAGEFVIAGVGTLFPPLIGSSLWLGSYAVVAWIADLVGLDDRSTALIVTIPLAVGFGVLYSLLAAQNLATQLYPDVAGARSAHYAAAAHGSNLIFGSGVTVAIAIPTLVLIDSADTKAAVFLGYGLILSALAFGPNPESPNSSETDRTSALDDLLVNRGLYVMQAPRSDDAALDPYLADIDLIATRGETEYAVAVARGDEGPKGTRWTAAANLKLGAFAASKLSADEPGAYHEVVPLLIVTASQEDERLVAYCRAENIGLVQVGEDGVRIRSARSEDSWLAEVDWQSLQPSRRKKEKDS